MTTFHEITGTRHYQYRQWNDGATDWSTWCDAGPATPETLAAIKAGFSENDEYEVRQVCSVSDESGTLAGELIFSAVVHRQELANPR